MTKTYHNRKLHHLKSSGAPAWIQLGDPEGLPLSVILALAARHGVNKIFACGKLTEMSREYMTEPFDAGWESGREFVFKRRTAVYIEPDNGNLEGRERVEITVKLISHRESWFPDCESMPAAIPTWRALEAEWASTGLPLLSSPAATGRALLFQTLPCDRAGNPVEFPTLPDELARQIRAISPQHRIEVLRRYPVDMNAEPFTIEPQNCIQYDGRWMYAAMCSLDRFPVGEPKRAGGFREYQPGIYDVTVRIPETWNHVGLIPQKGEGGEWRYPNAPGLRFRTWAFEPELTHALKNKITPWEIVEVHDGYAFEKGRPLLTWSNKLIEMRAQLQEAAKVAKDGGPFVTNHCDYAAAAIRQILNHTIGSIHKNEFERETFVSDDNFRKWRRENPHLAESERFGYERIEGGYLVPVFVPDTSRLSIFMPHWSATLYSLARARVAGWALRCDPSTLVKIHGDAIYSTIEQPELDKLNTGRIGQPRRKS